MIAPLLIATALASAPDATSFEGRFYRGEGDARYLELLDISRRMFDADPELQSLPMLYTPAWNGFVEGPTWGAWWIQNSYGTTYCALPFLVEPYITFLQNAQDLWFDQMGDGKRVFKWREFEWTVPDGQLCDAAAPGMLIPKQGDGRVDIHDWGVEFTAAGLLMQAELLLISRDPAAIARYLPRLERCANFLDTRRDPRNNLMLAGPAGNLLAPSYAGWMKADGTFDMAYLAGLSITYIAALDRLVEVEKLARRPEAARLYAERRELARKGLPLLTTPEGYFLKALDPDGTRHGVHGAAKHGYFEAVCNHDAICFRVADDAQSARIWDKLASIPGLRRHDVVITNDPSLDDMYEPPTSWLWQFGTWVNGGHWSTCEARMILAYYRLGAYADARRSMEHILKFARAFRMDNPLVDFGNAVYQPGEAVNLCYDTFGPPAAMVRGLFEYLYDAERLRLLPHIPPGIVRLEQRFPVRFGSKRLWIGTSGTGKVTSVLVNGAPWKRFDSVSVSFPDDETPEEARVQICLGGAAPGPRPEPIVERIPPPRDGRSLADLAGRFPVIAPNDLPLRIGADSHGASRFVGDIARPRVFSKALSAERIRALADNAAPTPDSGLVLDLDLAKRDGDRVPNAASGELPAKVVGDVEVVDSPHGKALRMAGKGYLEVADHPSLDLTTECTLEAWVAPGGLPAGGARILDKTTVGASDGYLLDTHPGASLRVICERGTISHDAKLAPGAWRHVAATISADGTLALYVDGRPVASEARGQPAPAADLVPRLERLREFATRMAAAGLGGRYEAAHAAVALKMHEALARRLELLADGKLSPLPARSQLAADRSYLTTAAGLCEGLEKLLASYATSDDPVRKRIHAVWRGPDGG